MTFCQQCVGEYMYDLNSFLFITFFVYMVVLTILLLLSWLVNLTSRHKQSIIEKEKA